MPRPVKRVDTNSQYHANEDAEGDTEVPVVKHYM